jgi:hypothetical protein
VPGDKFRDATLSGLAFRHVFGLCVPVPDEK